MINTDILQRGDKLMYGDDVVQVLSISKTSLRVYNITQDFFIPKWVEAKEFEYLEIPVLPIILINSMGVEKEVIITHDHELNKFNSLWELSVR